MKDIERHRAVFIEEAAELLSEIESSLLELSDAPNDMNLVDRIFRAVHTIKGSGGMFGFDEIVNFTHDLENILDRLRRKEIPVTKNLIDLVLSARDQIKKMIEDETTEPHEVEPLLREFRQILGKAETPDAEAEDGEPEPKDEKENIKTTYRIRFKPKAEIFSTGTNPILLINELRELGECQVIAFAHAVPPLKRIEPQRCYIHWNLILTTTAGIEAVEDVFIFVMDECILTIEPIDSDRITDEDGMYKRIGDILLERGDIDRKMLHRALESQRKIGEMLIEAGVLDPDTVKSALTEQQHVREIRKRREKGGAPSSIRVASDKLDTLVDLVGELVTVQASFTQMAVNMEDPDLISIAEEVERLTDELRDNTISIRMVPVSTMFGKFRRLVYDLSKSLNKTVSLTTRGGETELDKNVIDRLGDPMVHIIRNAIDHGIESPEIRRDLEKSEKGRIHLSAEHSGASVLIRITDDGAGLDAKAILERAKSKGLIPQDSDMSDDEIFSLIFAPGFSTAEAVSEVSGRGVGMDVVKRSIENLRGSVEIRSRKGEGSTITLKLPLTLAIIEGLLVEVGPTCYVLPISVVEECMELTSETVASTHGRDLINVRGDIIPYIYLRDFFKVDQKGGGERQIVIVRLNNYRVGLVVDNIIGEHQTVIKSMGNLYRNTKVYSGSTILADGTVALILDAYKLVETAEAEEMIGRNKRYASKRHTEA